MSERIRQQKVRHMHHFIVQCPLFRLQIIGDGVGREGVPHILEGVLPHTLQLVDLPDLIALDNIREDDGIVDVPNDGVNLVLSVALQMCGSETAQTDVMCQLSFPVLQRRVLTLECQILTKGQRVDPEGHIPAGKISRDL